MPRAQPRERLIWSWLIIGLSLAAVLWVTFRDQDRARATVAREDAALARLRQVLVAQRAFHEANEQYGWIEDLQGAGLLTGAPSTQIEGHTILQSPGYRIDILLPKRRAADGNVRIGPRDGDALNTRLSAKHFGAVARPTTPGSSGYRVYYIDESGKVLINDGVSDEQARVHNPLPVVHLSSSRGFDPGGARWYELGALDPD